MNARTSVSETDDRNTERVFIHDLNQESLRQLQSDAAAIAGLDRYFQDVMKDGSPGPEMAVIPAGMFEMGSNHREFGHRPEEAPQHYVTIQKAFAMGRYTITAEQFEAFRTETGWYLRPDLIWADGRFPVMNIRIADAQRYADWLSEQTGKSYRLPSEAEWEYACRAGTLSPFSFGESVSCRDVHFNAAFPYNEARDRRRWFLPRCLPMPKALMVGSLTDNLWGLFEMHGNVQEFTSTAWLPHHCLSHRDGSPKETADPKRIVVKGGSWFDPAVMARSAARMPRLRDELDVNLGFRLVRELD
jgi:formylglycine-generating enzyme required for sulfatase activity